MIAPDSTSGWALLIVAEEVRKIGPLMPPPVSVLRRTPVPPTPLPPNQTTCGMTPWRSRAATFVDSESTWPAEPRALAWPSVRVPPVTLTLPVKPRLALLTVNTLPEPPLKMTSPPPASWPASSRRSAALAPTAIVPPAVPTWKRFVLALGLKTPELSWNVPPLRMIWRGVPVTPAPKGPVAGSARS